MGIMAIDPANLESAYCTTDLNLKPITKDKISNEKLLKMICTGQFKNINYFCIESIQNLGMAVGQTVFDTCIWIGRFYQAIKMTYNIEPTLIYRKEEKLNICGTTKAKDCNITQALIDRFAPNTSNHGKGSKKEQGWFYGFRADIWQSYAVLVTYYDLYINKK